MSSTITTGTKRKTIDTENSSSDNSTTVVHADSTEPLPKKSKSELGYAVPVNTKIPEKARIEELIHQLGDFYEILPPQSPDKVKAAISDAKNKGYFIPPELETYFMTCDGFKKKDEDTEVLFFGLKSIIDTERGDDLNGCLVEQVEEEECNTWKENNETEPIKPTQTKKGVLIASGLEEETQDPTFVYMLCDPKSPYYGKLVSKSHGFTGAKVVYSTLADTFEKLAERLEQDGHIDTVNLFIPDLRDYDDPDDGEVDDDRDGDYQEEDEDDV